MTDPSEPSGSTLRPASPSPGDVLAGKYRVEGTVGKGGMGVVLSAQHLQLGQKVAIKLLLAHPSEREPASTRFLREARAAAGLHSDHVVRIYDLGTLENGVPFMVMELLRGSDLGTLIDTRGPLPINLALEYVLQACDAIAEAHALGIIHRDLKPSNLFLTRRSDGEPLIKVLDFGISKALGPDAQLEGDLTATRTVLGSPFYMSPEQVRDSKSVDSRSDVWALGVILQELLTGEPAFCADTFPGICAAIVADPPESIRLHRPDVPEEVEAVVRRCLEKNPRDRFQSVPELMRALEALVPRRSRSLPSLPPVSGDRGVSTNAPTVAILAEQYLASAPEEERSEKPDLSLSHGPVATPHVEPAASRPAPTRAAWIIGSVLAAGVAAGLLLASRRVPDTQASSATPTAVRSEVEPVGQVPAPSPSAAPAATAAPAPSAASPPTSATATVSAAPAVSARPPRRTAPSRRSETTKNPSATPPPTAPDIRMQR
jgi:eukaryotic-like serine/threonine-protein kinase